jgi:hypothetical protein
MTLSLDVLRLITWKALLGKTWAVDRVFDSPSTPSDVRVEDEQEPFIAVYVDDADFDVASEGEKSLMAGPGMVRLILEVAVGSPRSEAPTEGEDVPSMGGVTRINATDPALEIQMGLITRQALQALLSTNVNNPWSAIWREWVFNLTKVEVRRGGPGSTPDTPRPRVASRLVVLHVDTIGEPVRGDDLEEYRVWQAFFTACEDDPHLAGVGAMIRAHIEKPDGPLPSWRREQKWLMTSKPTMVGIGLAPVDGFDETEPLEEPPELTEVTPVAAPWPPPP